MVKKIDVINWAKDLANRGVGVNYDGAHGSQCVDLPFWIFGKFFGKPINGNAIDLLNSAKSVGYKVIYNAPGVNPVAGDIFVMHAVFSGVDYGHTGLVIADSDGYSMKTIEQNIDGNADALVVGGPARYNTRNFNNMVGWIRPNYEDGNKPVEEKKKEDEFMKAIELFKLEDGTTYLINLVEATYYHVPNPSALETIRAHYRFRFGEHIYTESITKARFNEYIKAFGLHENTL